MSRAQPGLGQIAVYLIEGDDVGRTLVRLTMGDRVAWEEEHPDEGRFRGADDRHLSWALHRAWCRQTGGTEPFREWQDRLVLMGDPDEADEADPQPPEPVLLGDDGQPVPTGATPAQPAG